MLVYRNFSYSCCLQRAVRGAVQADRASAAVMKKDCSLESCAGHKKDWHFRILYFYLPVGRSPSRRRVGRATSKFDSWYCGRHIGEDGQAMPLFIRLRPHPAATASDLPRRIAVADPRSRIRENSGVARISPEASRLRLRRIAAAILVLKSATAFPQGEVETCRDQCH